MKEENIFKEKVKSWGREIWEHKYVLTISILFLIVSIFLDILAGTYADKKASIPVTDLILDSIPTINLSFIFSYGVTLMILVGLTYTLFFKVRELHIVIGQFSLLVLIRSFFVTLTHLRRPTEAVVNAYLSHVPRIFIFENDLFFSGHVAIAFLGFLLFRKEKIGIFFLIMTPIMALTVLFMHVHYSIDVFAALFITYGSYKIGQRLFRKLN